MLHLPEPQWDEGWTMSVAQTWVEQGVYAQPLDGTLIAPSLAASFPTVMPVVLAFNVATVFTLASRLLVLEFTGVIVVSALMGMVWASRGMFRQRLQIDWGDSIQIVRANILAFVIRPISHYWRPQHGSGCIFLLCAD